MESATLRRMWFVVVLSLIGHALFENWGQCDLSLNLVAVGLLSRFLAHVPIAERPRFEN